MYYYDSCYTVISTSRRDTSFGIFEVNFFSVLKEEEVQSRSGLLLVVVFQVHSLFWSLFHYFGGIEDPKVPLKFLEVRLRGKSLCDAVSIY